ncbi:MAG: homocysteine biosynthesis protein [Armatimonadota bacterium]|nr:MAG: homocysteine biosynthesis protein [Armatimonadota bacterium]
MAKTLEEINEKIRKGQVVVVTAEEMVDVVAEKGPKGAADAIDVVTTGTFGPMCSSGAMMNVGHPQPRIKLGGGQVRLNRVPAYAGLAAVDVYIGATAIPDDDPRNAVFPGEFRYGGGHVIEDLAAGRRVLLEATAYGTDCYPRREIATWITLKELNEAYLLNPRNGYQNYNVAVNRSDRTIYTYMGTLKAQLGSANYCSAGQLSPLLNDPHYRTVGVGSRIFLGGGIGYVVWHGTQHSPGAKRNERGVPMGGAGTLAVLGDLKQMDSKWLRGASFRGYGATLIVGLGIPIPVLDEEIAAQTGISDSEIAAPVVDYSGPYPERRPEVICHVSYAQLKCGQIEAEGKTIPTTPLSSYPRAQEIAGTLKEWIIGGKFELSAPVAGLPGADSGMVMGPMPDSPPDQADIGR